MDVNEALKRARAAAKQVQAFPDLYPGWSPTQKHVAMSLAETFDALDSWLVRGGFLPTDWERAGQRPEAKEAGLGSMPRKPEQHRRTIPPGSVYETLVGCRQKVCACHDPVAWAIPGSYPRGCSACGCHRPTP